MAITTTQQTSIMKASSALFNKAFSPEMVTDFVSFYESNGNDLAKLADALIGSSTYTAQYAGAATVAEFGTILMAHYGLSYTGTTAADTNMKDFINYSFTNKASWATSLQTIQAVDKYLTATFIPSLATTDTVWGTMAQAVENKATVATNFKNNSANAGKELSLVSVTSDVATVTASTSAATAGQTFTLTTGSDTGAAFTGTAGNDTFNASVTMAADGTTLVDTLQGIDNLNGGAGIDTLKATINAGASVTPVLTSIENVEVRSTKASGELNLSASTGVTAIKVANSTSDMTLTSIGAASVAVANQNQTVNIKGSTATALDLTFDTVGTTVGTVITPITVNLGASTANTATSFAITANNAQVTMTETTASAATTSATIAATGKNQLTFAAADAGSLTSVSVTGAGSVDLSKVTLTAAKTLTVADGGVSATINNQTAAAVTIVTGAGVDTLSVSGAGLKSATTGAGNDVVTVGNAAQAVLAGAGATTGLGGTGVSAAVSEAAAITAVGLLTTAAVAAGTITAAQKVTIDTAADTVTDTAAATAAAAAAAGLVIATAGGVVSATATINLGAGDDTLTLGSAFATGATLTAGDGSDTLAMAKANYATVATYTTTNLAKVTGFETLSITDALVNADSIDVSKIAGLTSFKAAAGITSGQTTSAVTNLGAASTVELAGAAANNGTLTATLKTDTAADTMTLKLNKDYTDNNDTTINALAAAHTVVAATVETLNVVSTGNMAAITPVAGYKADLVTNTLTLDSSNALTSVVVSGNQALSFTSTAAMTKLATIDGSSNTGGITFDGALADMTTTTTSVAMTIKGSLTAANTLTGTGHADTIIGGSAADTIKGGLSGDTLTGNGGNDKFVYGSATESTITAGQTDTITDFIANTVGNATTGAVKATTDATKINGDVIDLSAFTSLTTGIKVGVYANASDAATFISNSNTADGNTTTGYAALDSSTNKLYIDVNSDGTSDMYINLTGVTTIDAAAFIMV